MGGKFIGKVGAKITGKVLSKFSFGVLDVGLGIWEIYDGVKAIKEGNAKAKEFRKAGKKAEEWKKEVKDLFGKIKKRCDDSSQEVSCQFTDWSSWGSCKYLNSSRPTHIEEGLTCGNSAQERSRSMTFQDGTAQDAPLCTKNGNNGETSLFETRTCHTYTYTNKRCSMNLFNLCYI